MPILEGGSSGVRAPRTRRFLRESLTSRLFLSVFFVYMLFAAIVMLVQLGLGVVGIQSDIKDEMEVVGESFSAAIEEATWALDQRQINSLVAGVARSDSVSSVKIFGTKGESIATIRESRLKSVPFSFIAESIPAVTIEIPLSFESSRGVEYLGRLVITANSDITLGRIKHTAVVLVRNALVTTFGLWIIFYLVMRSSLIAPIRRLETAVSKIDLSSDDPRFSYSYGHADELGRLANSIGELQSRLAAAIREVKMARTHLELRLAERTEEVESAQRELREIEIARSRVDERNRLLEDMHDGFGSQLQSARLMAERGNLSGVQLSQLLNECMEDLYLVVDLLGNRDRSILSAFIDYRHRMQNRVVDAPYSLAWELNLADCPPLPDQVILQLLRIVQEAVTNAIKHSHAENISISASVAKSNALLIKVSDDGKGVSAAHRAGRGLNNMRKRARLIGGALAIISGETGASGTRVELSLPLGSATTV